ncbi:hypothetical protein [Eubacterium sp.]|uniref:hypothetical protein n=1 Tax=Eubacterium sp. TaxID=142586 RepID=UPI0025F6AA82|nr:hypothetical protein [Eubacterium sp.]MCR5629092.1 hypothetical protein [Eubacterium sp.]
MDIIIELIIDIVSDIFSEGVMYGATSKKVPKPIRFLFILILCAFLIGFVILTIFLLATSISLFIKQKIAFALGMLVISILCLAALCKFVGQIKYYKDKKHLPNNEE